MLDSVWILLALLQGPAPVAAPPLPAVVDAGLLPASATGVRHQWGFAKRNTISNDASFKTDVDRTSDWRVSHVAALQAGLNAVLALKVSHEINYRNEPVPGFTRADTVAAAAIVASF